MDSYLLVHELKRDLESLGLSTTDVDITIAKKFSKTYYGLYYPVTEDRKALIRLYPYMTSNNDIMYPYSHILDTAIHEMCHHLQYSDDNYVRVKGVVHNQEFWDLYNYYIAIAMEKGYLEVK